MKLPEHPAKLYSINLPNLCIIATCKAKNETLISSCKNLTTSETFEMYVEKKPIDNFEVYTRYRNDGRIYNVVLNEYNSYYIGDFTTSNLAASCACKLFDFLKLQVQATNFKTL